ncbi:M23 family metallopeptidase [Metabacillus fastidiosus]|uniref:M23 family metallopeptidase n=1 Tax=Metabacillus fastidiosus TaxID=1458 RepID=A0ABU6P0U7_9BACI|nr:M23 family metallopeptidase [Metabacillus fastidiosus]MED4402979.1 M23 family metallopeptidase [Metabacillus fastidiosus]MED4455209.1 M23 family metallopeptidase [Metabacillus fastidiosus]MED4461397.1 M23 family metallopeptidase [Metabacillus fastidiosus]
MRKWLIAIIISMIVCSSTTEVFGAEKKVDNEYDERMSLYKKMETITNIDWYVFAAVDQYERNIRHSRRDIPKADGLIEIYIRPEVWAGLLNPNPHDNNTVSIALFNGMGLDGNGDGRADQKNDEDILYTFANYLQSYGSNLDNIKIGLWNYYKRDKTVGLILGHMKIYKTYGRLNLDEHAFPMPLKFNFSYNNTWGDARGWGGRRIHEGTDIFANYGVPVRSTCYGIVEMKGWNRYGGWRVGIRDLNNNYHYFAHLNGFAKGLNIGQAVEPSQLIGAVGSSGYGPPGTAGKFPPHLHYGIYKDNGKTEWSFDPYPHLKAWERAERLKNRKK